MFNIQSVHFIWCSINCPFDFQIIVRDKRFRNTKHLLRTDTLPLWSTQKNTALMRFENSWNCSQEVKKSPQVSYFTDSDVASYQDANWYGSGSSWLKVTRNRCFEQDWKKIWQTDYFFRSHPGELGPLSIGLQVSNSNFVLWKTPKSHFTKQVLCPIFLVKCWK